MAGELATELEYYEAHKAQFLVEHEGEFVLIKGETVIGFFQNEQDAIAEGYKQFQLAPFFVRHISPIEPELNYTRLMLGVS